MRRGEGGKNLSIPLYDQSIRRWERSTWLSSLNNIGLVKKFVQVMEKNGTNFLANPIFQCFKEFQNKRTKG